MALTETVLPPAIMERVFQYLDASDLAHMAQTCVVWKRIVYRNSVWESKNLSYRTDPFLMYSKPPRGARHNGSPNNACFLAWLSSAQDIDFAHLLPKYVTHLTDPEKYISAAKKWWVSHGSPCVHLDHHNIYDLFKVPFPDKMSNTDVKRILCRFLQSNVSRTRNPIFVYLSNKHNEMIKHLPVSASLPPGEAETDPLRIFRYSAVAAQRARCDTLIAKCREVGDRYNASSISILRHSISEFQTNDAWLKSDRESVWCAAAFSCAKKE